MQDTRTILYYDATSHLLRQECGEFNFRSNEDHIALVVYHLVIMFVLPLVIMAYCYANVIVALWRSSKGLLQTTHASRPHRYALRE